MTQRMSRRKFERIVNEVLDAIPENFLPYLRNVAVEIREEPDDDELEAAEHGDLLGLFEGVPFTEQSFGEGFPNRISLFRGPLLRMCDTESELRRQIRKTILHELAHHFGYSEEDLEEFESLP